MPDKFVGVLGGVAVIVSVTVTVRGEFVTKGADDAIGANAVYVPVASATVDTARVTVAGAVLDDTDALSHPVGCPA